MVKKVIVLFLWIALIFNFELVAFSDPVLIESKNKAGKNVLVEPQGDATYNSKLIDIKNASYGELQSRLDKMEINIEKMDAGIEKIYRELDEINKNIKSMSVEVEETKKKLDEASEKLDSTKELFHKRMRALYINGHTNYIEIIFSSDSLDGFINNLEIAKEIMEYDNSTIKQLKYEKSVVEEQKRVLEEKINKLVALKNNKESKLKELEESRKQENILILEAKRQQRLYLANKIYSQRIRKNQAKINETIKNIEKLVKEVPTMQVSRGSVPISQAAVVVYAAEFLGRPYVYGGNGPKYFDCSGFVKYVYAHFGIELSRTTYTQVKEGVYVPRDKLQLGDLIFFGTKYNVHHVGIYVGNDCYIHAPHTGDRIKISILTRNDYVCARRIIPEH
ncbi:gamma-D-glutamyl-L-lysine endopeptidase [Clostridium tepidiprofundi DSM 19306]|uniref:Gamma-D-glutamyl-L-lysine endopeptidase n=1 Tax=Clostridium tepidiprofundi DSM 19306 TaxID=1121338 RepID=A0A151B350_9CLOT|nr:C40 family peptidase [Clostridium tepidiprofundi]KYH34182.1 gamma-D-glutamyl-L-lysine endopeptidase [Clostridium tepidiprofundi DSM 19306]